MRRLDDKVAIVTGARGGVPQRRFGDPDEVAATWPFWPPTSPRTSRAPRSGRRGLDAGMRVGVVSEVKANERRVALTPAGVRSLRQHGHDVVVQAGAGQGAGFADDDYRGAGAGLSSDAEEIWREGELLLKVKEPVPSEHRLLHGDLILFTYLHLAADRALTEALLAAGTTAVAYETVEDAAGGLPLLTPMSEIAGRLAAAAAAQHLQEPYGGPGLLMSGAPGVRPARVLVVGGGVVGTEAAAVARGMGAEVVILERSLERIRRLDALFGGGVRVLMSDAETLLEEARAADVSIGAVLLPARNEIYTLVESFADPEPGLENSTITPIAGDVCAFWFSAEELGSASHGLTGTIFATIESGLEEMAAACQDMWLHGVSGERLTFSRAQ